MGKAIAEIVVGASLIALDILAPELGIPLTATWAAAIASTGAGLVIGGIGSLLTKQQVGLGANVRNPISPWNVVYGRARIGGTVVFIEETGESDKYLHLVYVLACHPCQSIDAVLFDGKRICLDTSGNSLSFDDSTSVIASQQTVNIATITRTNGVVTVVMSGAIGLPASTAAGPAVTDGDTLQIQNVTADQSLNGQYQIQLINSTTFTYICGGADVAITSQGQVVTTWPDYGDTVHVETALGTQSSNPFPGLTAGGDTGSNGLWTANHALQGRTAVYLRLKYGGNIYASGIPTISFLVSGKNDIYDARSGTRGYTTNSALCIADFLCHQTWGFKCNYGTDVPNGPLMAAANICDETVTLANGNTESRYACNGSFQLSAKRGEILQNLLTSCGGRLTYSGGQFVVSPAAWTGTSVQLYSGVVNASGSPAVSATLSILTSHVPGSPDPVDAMCSVNGLSLFSRGFMDDSSAWTKRTDTHTLSLTTLQGLRVECAAGTAITIANDSPPDQFLVYDCWVDVTFADGTNGTYRPTVATVDTSVWNSGTITNPGNAIDGNTTDCATIQRSFVNTLDFSPVLVLSDFNFPSQTTFLTPDILPVDMTYAAGPFQWRPKLATRDLYNGVKATYVSPLNSWQASDMPPYAQDADHGYTSDANLAADGGDRRWLDLQFPFTISVATAQRLAKVELLRRRQQGNGTFAFNLAMYQVMPMDVIEMTIPFLGWTNKLLEVTAHRFTIQQGDGSITLGTELDLQETDPSIYDWSTSEELTPEGYQQAQPSNITNISAPAGVTLTNSTVTGTGTSTGQVKVTWTASTDGYVVNGGQTLVQYSLDNTNWIALGSYDSSVSTVFVPNVAAGQQYWVRIAYVNAAGIQSPWTVQGPLTATGSSLRRIDDETPAGTQDGSNPTFTLAQAPSPAASLRLLLDGSALTAGLDYTLSGSTITMISYLPNSANGDVLRAFYWY